MSRQHFILSGLLAAGVFALSVARANAAGPATTNATAAAVSNAVPVSVFEDAVTAGKDPFFPKSRRRSVDASAAAPGAAPDVTSLVLQGISSTSRRPLATINNQSFSPGEEGEVITTVGRVRIRCEEIRPDSVVIYLGAQRVELRLPQR